MSLLFTPAVLDGSAYVPSDRRIYEAAGTVTLAPSGYVNRPENCNVFLNPRAANWMAQSNIEICGETLSFSDVGTYTYSGDGQVRFQTVADPDNASKTAYYMRVVQGDPTLPVDGEKRRLELVPPLARQRIQFGRRYWMCHGFRAPAAWKSASRNTILGPGIGSIYDEVTVFQVHEEKDAADEPFQPPLTVNLIGGGAATPWLSELEILIRFNQNAVGTVESTQFRTLFSELDWPADQWQLWVWDTLWHWDEASGPYLRAWRKVGAGAWKQVIDYVGPNCYNDELPLYPKQGVYYFANAWTNGATEKTMHSKGMTVMSHESWMTEAVMQDYVEAI